MTRTFSFLIFWKKLTPFFLSGLLFFTGVGMLFSGVPLWSSSVPIGWLFLTNTALVALLGGGKWVLFYGVFFLAVGPFWKHLFLAKESFYQKRRLERHALLWVLSLGSAWASVGLVLGKIEQGELFGFWKSLWGHGQVILSKFLKHQMHQDPALLDTLQKRVLQEIPSTICILLGLIFLFHFLSWVYLRKKDLNQDSVLFQFPDYFFRLWKLPDGFVWAVIGLGGLALLTQGLWWMIGINGLKIFGFLYVLQGWSVLVFFFHKWKIQPFWKYMLYLFHLLFLTLFLSVLGFFDVWFDFRKKFGQA